MSSSNSTHSYDAKQAEVTAAHSQSPVALEEGAGDKSKKVFIESDAGDGSKREDQYLHGTKLILCLLSLYCSLFLVALDQTIIVTLLSDVGNKFDALDQVGWLASGFLLSLAVFVATWGKLSIIFGRKYAMFVAIILFEAGSLMCALASSMNILIGGRVLAGVGGGGIQSLVFIIVAEIVPIEKRPLAMGLVGCVFAVASVLGPLIGGAFTTHVTWRWCFYINLPIGAVAFVFLVWAFNPPKPEGSIKQKLKMIDYLGTVLITIAVVLFLLGLTFGSSEYSWNSAAVICCLVIGIVFMFIFGAWNFGYSKNPILPWEVVRVPQVMASTVMIFSMFAFFMSSALYLSVYFQSVWGADAWHSGLHLLPMIIPVVIASISTGITINKSRYVKPFAVFGGALGPIGCGLITLLSTTSSSSQKIGLLIIVGVSCGLQMQSAIISSQISAPKTPGGTIMATTVVNFGRGLGGALGSILSDVAYNTSFKNKYKEQFAKLTDQSIIDELSTIDVKQITTSSAILKTMSPAASNFVKEQMVYSMRNVFYMCIGFAGMAFISSLCITNKRLPAFSSGASAAAGEGKKEEEPVKVLEQEGEKESDDASDDSKNNLLDK